MNNMGPTFAADDAIAADVPPLVAAASDAPAEAPAPSEVPADAPTAPAAPEAYVPDGLPNELRGTTDRETIDLLAKRVGQIVPAPAKAEEYTLTLEGAIAERFGDMKDDPVLPLWKETAHELGLSQAQFQQAFEGLYGRMMDKGLIEPPIDVAAEFAALAPAERDRQRQQTLGKQRLNAVSQELKGIIEKGGMPAEAGMEMAKLLSTAKGVMALEAVLKWRGERGVQPGGSPPAAAPVDPLAIMYPSMVTRKD